MTVVPTAAPAAVDRLRKILQIRQLTALGRSGKVTRQLSQLARCAGISLRLRRLRGRLQICRNLFGDLGVLSRIRLL